MRDKHFDAIAAMASRRALLTQTAENSARTATVQATIDTTGVGDFVDENVVTFGLTFFEKPIISYGMCVDGDGIEDSGLWPISCGGVYRWQLDKCGHWIGAWCWVSVSRAEADLPLEHHFTFTGTARKDVPAALM